MPCSQFISGFGGPAHLSKNIMRVCVMAYITLLCKHWFASLTSRTSMSGWAAVPQWAPFTHCPTCTIMEAVLPPSHQRETIFLPLCKIPILVQVLELAHIYITNTRLMNEKVSNQSLVFLMTNSLDKCSQSVASGPAASASPGNLLKCRFYGPLPGLLNQKLCGWNPGNFNKPSDDTDACWTLRYTNLNIWKPKAEVLSYLGCVWKGEEEWSRNCKRSGVEQRK